MNKKANTLLHIVIAIPSMVLTMWVMSVPIFGIGLAMPYGLMNSVPEFGFFRVLIFGTLINLVLAGLSAVMLGLQDSVLDVDKLMGYAMIETILIMVIITGRMEGWSW